MNQLNAYMALEIMHDSMERAERERRARLAQEPPARAVSVRTSRRAQRPLRRGSGRAALAAVATGHAAHWIAPSVAGPSLTCRLTP